MSEDIDQYSNIVNEENRQSLTSILSKAVGADLSKLTLPVTVNEPISFLQKLCEQTQYSELLDYAAGAEDSIQRLCFVTAFGSSMVSSVERVAKPFNPLLGETFEYYDPTRKSYRYVAEQVSHHPPISASFCETNEWSFSMDQQVKSRFLGNSIEITIIGYTHVWFKETGEHYRWENSLKCCAHNVILGTIWLDHYGDVEFVNMTTGEKAKVKFKPCGWFSKGWHEIEGTIYDAKNTAVINIKGKWNESISVSKIRDWKAAINTPSEKPPEPFLKKSNSQIETEDKKDNNNNSKRDSISTPDKKSKKSKKEKKPKKEKKKKTKKVEDETVLWRNSIQPLPSSDPRLANVKHSFFKGWTDMTFKLAECDAELKKKLPKSDSRLRGDRIALGEGDTKKASNEKYELEEKQRNERKLRETKKEEWKPKYFKLTKDSDGIEYWAYQNNYPFVYNISDESSVASKSEDED